MASKPFENTNNILKDIQDKLKTIVPEQRFLFQNRLKMKPGKMVGNKYICAIEPNLEQAVTPGGNTRNAYTLRDANAGRIDQLQITPYEATNRAEIAKGMLESSEKGDVAYANVGRNRSKSIVTALKMHQEIDYRYGQVKKAEFDSASNATAITSGYSALTAVMDLQQYSIGMFAGMGNAPVEFFDSAGTQIGGTGYFRRAVNWAVGTRTMLFEFELSADRDAVVSAAAGLEVWFEGERTGVATYDEKVGIDKIITTSTGTLFNVDLDANDLFRGNTLDVSALTNKKMNFLMLMDALNIPISLGLSGKTVNCHINAFSFPGFIDDEAALRRYQATGKAVNGFKALEFLEGDVTIKIIVDPLIKYGEALIYCEDDLERVGTHDVELDSFFYGNNQEGFIHQVPNKNAYEIRCSVDDAIYSENPAGMVKISGIVATDSAYDGT